MAKAEGKKTRESSPVKEGQLLTLKVEALNHQGEGVARREGFTLFLPGALPGDLVTARVISQKKAYARALPVEMISPSPHRVDPPCRHHEDCGGCQLQALSYEEQLRHKRAGVEEALRRLGGLEVPVRPTIGMADPWRYRNKAQFPLSLVEGKTLMGFFQKGSHALVDIETCPVQTAGNEEVFQASRRAVTEARVPIYDEQTHKGLLRHVIARSSLTSGENMVILVTTGPDLPNKEILVKTLREGIEKLAGIVQNINPRRGNRILGEQDITLWGKPYIEENLGGMVFRISPQSFFQVNTLQAAVLLEKIKELAQVSSEKTVFDLYCGTGTIALYLSPYCQKVVGVESVAPAIADACRNAALNGITNAEFFLGRAEDVVPRLMEEGYAADVAVVDPPRGGCQPGLLAAIVELAPGTIVYVSCNPSTLARDLKYLAREGYRPLVVQPVDMFPHTHHVETVVLMSRAKE